MRAIIFPTSMVADVTTDFVTQLSHQGPLVVFCLLIGMAGYRKWWRWGYQYDEMRDQLLKNNADLRMDLTNKDKEIERVRADLEADIIRVRRQCDDDLARIVRDKDQEYARVLARADKYEAYVAESVAQNKETVTIVNALALRLQAATRESVA